MCLSLLNKARVANRLAGYDTLGFTFINTEDYHVNKGSESPIDSSPNTNSDPRRPWKGLPEGKGLKTLSVAAAYSG